MKILNDQEFVEEVLKSDKPVVVDFFADWCGPCKMMGPIFEETANEEEVKDVKFVKVNVDDAPETSSKLGIRSIPTLIIFKNGKAADTNSGVITKERLISWIKSAI